MCATSVTNTPSPRKKTVVLFGAPHKNGVTGQVLEHFLAATADEITVVDAFARAVMPCDDCRGCHALPRCVKRDMDDVYDAVEQADRLIFLTPVYNRSFPAPLKAVVDRLQCYWARRFVHGIRPPIAKPKTALLITVCGSDRDDGACVEYQLAPQLTVLHVTDTKTLHIRGTDGGVDGTKIARQLQEVI